MTTEKSRLPLSTEVGQGQNAALAQALTFNREARTVSVGRLLRDPGGPARRNLKAVQLGTLAIALMAVVSVASFALDRLPAFRRSLAPERAISNDRHAAPLATAPSAGASTPPESIAVLPFVNMSGDPKQEYFSDGLSEELIDHLVHGTNLKVIARTSSFQFKGRSEDARSIARQLAVTHLLEGSVRKDRQHLHVTAQLIRASDGVYVWSRTYDRSLIEIFNVQDEIAEQVSQALRVALRSDHRSEGQQPDIRAYNLVLEGNYFKARRTLRDVESAVQLYQQAIDISPNYALAWARLASAYLSAEVLKGPPSEDQNKRVLATLQRAIQIDPNLPFAYYTRGGFELNVTWDWAAALADTKHVREIDPRFDHLQIAFGFFAYIFGDVDKAAELYEEQLERNPVDPNYLDALGSALCAADRLQECLHTRLRVLQLHPEFGLVNSSVGIARLYLGQFDAALEAMRSEPDEDGRLSGLAIIYSAMGRRTESDAALTSLTAKFASNDPYAIAEVCAFRGEIDAAFGWLERAYRQRSAKMIGLKADPLLRNLHSDPRFEVLVARMRLPDELQSKGPDLQI